jgi:hypothetical protein
LDLVLDFVADVLAVADMFNPPEFPGPLEVASLRQSANRWRNVCVIVGVFPVYPSHQVYIICTTGRQIQAPNCLMKMIDSMRKLSGFKRRHSYVNRTVRDLNIGLQLRHTAGQLRIQDPDFGFALVRPINRSCRRLDGANARSLASARPSAVPPTCASANVCPICVRFLSTTANLHICGLSSRLHVT